MDDKLTFYKVLIDIAPLLVAAIVAIIVYRQYRNDLRSTRLNLYDKRFKVYTETKKFLFKITEGGPLEIKDLIDIKESYFLFEKADVYDYLDKLQNVAVNHNHELKEITDEIRRVGNGGQTWYNSEAWEQKVTQEREQMLWFRNEYESIEQRFMKYLDFRKAEPEPLRISNIWKWLNTPFQWFKKKVANLWQWLTTPIRWFKCKVSVLQNRFKRTKSLSTSELQ